MGVLDKIRGATRARRIHTLCLDAALQAEHDRLQAGLQDAADLDAREASLATPASHLLEVVEQLEAVRDRMQDSLVTFAMEPMPWSERIALQALHPPREGQVLDAINGYNIETFLPALVKASTVWVEDADGDRVSDVPDDAWENIFATLNYGGVDRLSRHALEVNDEDTRVPTSARSLLESQDSGASLAQPNPGTSPHDDSEDGNRPTSPTSSTTTKATGARKTAKKATPSSSGSSTGA